VVVAPYAIVYAGAEIGEDTQICPYAHIREGVRIGKRCVIGCGVRIGFDAVIGDDVQIMDDTHISGGTVIGNNCFISVQVLAVNDDKPRGYEWKGITPVTIGSNVVVGAGARLRPGIRIGDDATIAMGAIVTRDVPAGAMVKGEPARVVGRSREIGHAALEYVTEDDLIAGLPRQVYPEGIESVG
jgi:acetyltransferase-like isoleucine patch superfamily enzyme